MEAQIKKDSDGDVITMPVHDCLTALFSHGWFHFQLEREITRFDRGGAAFTLALIDVDGFAVYNQRYGYPQGDRMLKDISAMIQSNIRRADVAARFGGDVFAVIFTGCDCGRDFKAAERIRTAVENLTGSELTLSIGLAAYPCDAKDKAELLHKAQKSLKAAKLHGKNTTCSCDRNHRPEADGTPRVLIVDDEPRNLKLLEALLISQKFKTIKALNGQQALEAVMKSEIDLILLDVMMPGMDGFEVCRRLKDNNVTRMVPVILVTALDDMESRIKGIQSGADDFLTKPPNKAELLARTRSLVKLRKLNNDLTDIENVLFSLANTVEAKDVYTQGHIERVANVAVTLGRKMGLDARTLKALRFGGILHDIGKIGVPGHILNKAGPLSEADWQCMRTHPEIGYKICLPLERNLGEALDVIRHHHEKLDGTGYPDGLQGDQVSMVARIMAIADIYDALVTDRPYRQGLSRAKAFRILQEEAEQGKVDREVVALLIEAFA